MPMKKIWHQLFLEERPSIALAFFRIAVALTIGIHVLPTFMHLDDNYYPTALKSLNGSFFPHGILMWVSQSPVWMINCAVIIFCIALLSFFIGWRTQISGIVLTLACYYFYALNSFYIGTLSWDILLVTLVLMIVTPYPGDYFSIDALRHANRFDFRRERPFFIQRLLQCQIAFTFFYTALYKISAQGNWLTGNPIYELMNLPTSGVIKNFMFKEWLGGEPRLCYVIGISVICCELLMPFLLWYKRTRRSAIVLGCIFHVLLLLTMDVPSIFFFLFPAQLMLFINPRDIVQWIDTKRQQYANVPRVIIVFDGHCGFCRISIGWLNVMDLFGRLEFVSAHAVDVTTLHSQLTLDKTLKQMYVIEQGDRLTAGFYGFRRLCWYLPMLYPMVFVAYLPFAGPLGQLVYRCIAANRFLFHQHRQCKDNHCLG